MVQLGRLIVQYGNAGNTISSNGGMGKAFPVCGLHIDLDRVIALFTKMPSLSVNVCVHKEANPGAERIFA